MPDFRNAYRKVRPSIVGIGISENGEIDILGTGFFYTSQGHIITNKHVFECLLTEREDGTSGIARGASAWVMFPHGEDGGNKVWGMVALKIISALTIPNPFAGKDPMVNAPKFRNLEPSAAGFPDEPDIAILEIKIPTDVDFPIPIISADIRRVDETFSVGTPVAVMGFPGGLSFDATGRVNQTLQMTPLMQTGSIAGILPFPDIPNPETFVLDMFITPGSSGSPVFDEGGTVIGLLFATRLRQWPLCKVENGGIVRSETEFIGIPNSLGLALPTSRFPEGVFSHIASVKSNADS